MICPDCGASNREDARFCRSCGKSLVEPAVAPPKPAVDTVEILLGEPEFGTEPAEAPMEESLPGPETETPADEEEKEESGVTGEAPAPGTNATETEGKEDKGLATAEAQEPLPPSPNGGEAPEGEITEPPLESEAEVVGFWREEVEPLTPLDPGTVIAGRYVLIEAQDVQRNEILYLARDLQRCWQCGFEENAPDEAFCGRCGASLAHKPEVHLAQLLDSAAEPSSGTGVDSRLEQEGLHFALLREPKAEPKGPAEQRGFRLLVGQRSDVGQVRQLDEDSLLALSLAPTYESCTSPVLGLFAVADGMGGHEGGEVASKLALRILAEQMLQTVILPEFSEGSVSDENVIARLRRAVLDANDAVYLARQKAASDMGTTLTAAYIRNEQLFWAHVGDTRAYRWGADGLQQLTTDHSVIASMIDSGQAAPEEIYTNPHRSVIYRSIGDKPEVEVDTDLLTVSAGDRLIFCCDGLWETIRDEGIADVMMQEADPQVACDVMVKRANTAGGEDNISVIVVQVEMM